jgi:hypothetical protein
MLPYENRPVGASIWLNTGGNKLRNRWQFSYRAIVLYYSRSIPVRYIMQDINPITNKIMDLKGRSESLRGYL